MGEKELLLDAVARLETLLAELKERLPAHSIPPAMIAEMDELDEQLEQARAKLVELERSSME